MSAIIIEISDLSKDFAEPEGCKDFMDIPLSYRGRFFIINQKRERYGTFLEERGMSGETFKVRVLPIDTEIEVAKGTTFLDAQILAGLHPDAPCGGIGTCGKCLVDVAEGLLGPEEAKAAKTRTVKACQNKVEADITLIVREETEHHLLESGTQRQFELLPAIKSGVIHVDRCEMGDNSSDWQRVKEAVSSAFGIDADSIPVNPWILDKVFDVLEENDYTVTAILYNNEVIDLLPADEAFIPYGAAFDIGTTSVVCYLLDLKSGKEISHSSMLNPQSQYGADVIARSEYAIANGVSALSDVIRKALNELIEEALAEAGSNIKKEEIYLVTIVGNTCMHHLFMGITPKPLVHAPYNTSVNDEIIIRAKEADIFVNPAAKLQMLPNIAGFVGADTAGVLLAAAFDEIEELTLAIDIGTNGEMVMGSKDRMIACSTAAGPAFEGAKIECGMRGRDGAIDHIRLAEDGSLDCHVIDDVKAEGLCGSGLLDAVAIGLESGLIDDAGKLFDPEKEDLETAPAAVKANAGRLTEKESGRALMLKDEVYLSQKDIREVQLAKGAIAAGIDLMADRLGIKIGEIKKVLIAGAFGNYMDPHSACAIGMIPAELEDRIEMIGNAAGEGSKIATLNFAEYRRAQKITERVEFLELATHPDFQDTFVDNLMFE